jgi:hypothetical protein
MNKLWQLKKISTGEALNEPQPLPENWGPIVGLHGFKEKLSNLGDWLGEPYLDQGWFETDLVDNTKNGPSKAELVLREVQEQLKRSDWAVLPDVPMTLEEKQAWIEYRRLLRNVKLQGGFPNDVEWPGLPK